MGSPVSELRIESVSKLLRFLTLFPSENRKMGFNEKKS